MQQIVIDEPYEFIPPSRGNLWPWILKFYLKRYLNTAYGIADSECRGTEHLKASLAAGHGIVLAPNHCRPCDPMVMGLLSREAGCHVFAMASWHLFKQSAWMAFMVRRMGGFSIYREGMDRASLNCAIDILADASRPLVIFPEGAVSRTNELLGVLQEGVAFIARMAARKRAKASPAGKVVVHPVSLTYHLEGDVKQTVSPVLDEIEHRLSWQPQHNLPLPERIAKVGRALLCLKEVEYFGEAQPNGDRHKRIDRLLDHLLVPLEEEWLDGVQDSGVVVRVKNLRTAILPDMVTGRITDEERERRWRQLADLYLAQQLSLYPPDYFTPNSRKERMLEVVEKFEEDLTDLVRVHAPLKVIIQVDRAIEVSPKRDRGATVDPLMQQLETRLKCMLENSASEKRDPSPSPESKRSASTEA